MPRRGELLKAVTTLDIDILRERAALTLSATPRPFLRWVGSKRTLLPRIANALPGRYSTYYEPFLGSGSLFFLLEPARAILSDSCSELMGTFEAVREHAAAVLRFLRPLKPDKELFYWLRANRSQGQYKRAAEFIYLNKTCWNGLYRVNSRGEFNVPYGLPRTDYIIDEDNLRACSTALNRQHVELRCCDFEEAVKNAGEDDLVFLDPPYVTGHNNNGFIDYNEQLFSWSDQTRLARVAGELVHRGAHVLVTNAFHQDLIDLYEGFNLMTINRSSTLASISAKRGRVNEALFWCHNQGT